MDDKVFQQLKDSKFRYPEVTEVIFEAEKMAELGVVALINIEYRFDVVWDRMMFDFIWKYFRTGMNLAEKQARERKAKFRLIIETTKENIEQIKSLKYCDIRHIANIRSNFGILDERAYMVQIFYKEEEPPAQSYFSNSTSLVECQQKLFERLWEMATPLENRVKEIEYQDRLNYNRILTKQDEIYNEIISIMGQTRKELLVFSSANILIKIIHKIDFIGSCIDLLDRNAVLNVLTSGNKDEFLDKIKSKNNNKDKVDKMSSRFTDKLGNFNELVMVSDNKYVLQIKYESKNNDDNDNLIASFSNEEHQVLVQEIMFEKQWNEVNGLASTSSTMNNN